jgi:hypothetical protein
MLAAQIVGNVAGGCVCCCAKRALAQGSRTIAILCLVLSWFVS